MTRETVEITVDSETSSQPPRTVMVGREAAWNDSARYRLLPGSVPRDELFFWTQKWQAGERESADERAAGKALHFENGADLLDWLRAPED